jgi:hypothetical protein
LQDRWAGGVSNRFISRDRYFDGSASGLLAHECWPNANAANSSRPRAFFFRVIVWTAPCQAPCPMRPHAAPCTGVFRSGPSRFWTPGAHCSLTAAAALFFVLGLFFFAHSLEARDPIGWLVLDPPPLPTPLSAGITKTRAPLPAPFFLHTCTCTKTRSPADPRPHDQISTGQPHPTPGTSKHERRRLSAGKARPRGVYFVSAHCPPL